MKYSAILALALAATAFADEAAPAQQQGGSMMMSLLPFVLMFVVMYLFFIRPKQKEMKKMDEMRKALKRGDQVLTAAGIVGTVANIEGSIITIKTAGDTKLDFEKSAIAQVLSQKDAVKAEEKKA